MKMPAKPLLAAAVTLGFASLPFVGIAKANDAEFRFIQYHAFSQPVVYCAARLYCEIVLQPGERIKDSVHSQASFWDGQMLYEGESVQTPHLALKPPMPGLAGNAIITTNRRTYRLLFRSVDREFPSYTVFRYDDEARLAASQRAKFVAARAASPQVTATPATIADEMDAACGSMPASDWYGLDLQPAEIRPARVCHSLSHTYVQMTASPVVPADLPVLLEASPEGERVVNASYDAASRTYRVDDVAAEYVLVSGKRRMRVQLQHPKVAARR